MSEFPVRTAEQLPTLLQAFRKQSGLTQAEVALRLGVTQQTLSALERNADKVGAGRLLQLLGILGVELVLRDGAPGSAEAGPDAASAADPSGPQW
ncbi:MAG TPA: helix-turn-helix transcriptional regulator [Duganella sp.]|jgi:HTH-type transcriptional regulator/antitoxin HipB